jgi:hypothetical protein
VQPLGNLVILCAQAENRLFDLIASLQDADGDADAVLKRDDVLALVRDRTGFEGFALLELLKGIENYWADRELRNRYFHDDWFVVIRDGTPAIRGLPRKKGSKIEFNDPTAEEIWELAERFREYENLFSYAASVIGRRHQQPDPAPASASRRSRPI